MRRGVSGGSLGWIQLGADWNVNLGYPDMPVDFRTRAGPGRHEHSSIGIELARALCACSLGWRVPSLRDVPAKMDDQADEAFGQPRGGADSPSLGAEHFRTAHTGFSGHFSIYGDSSVGQRHRRAAEPGG